MKFIGVEAEKKIFQQKNEVYTFIVDITTKFVELLLTYVTVFAQLIPNERENRTNGPKLSTPGTYNESTGRFWWFELVQSSAKLRRRRYHRHRLDDMLM